MTTETRAEPRLSIALTGATVETIPDVIARMRELDAVLPDADGLKWFNLLYLMVTEQIGRDFAAGLWADQEWLSALDVAFARLYFGAIVAWEQEPDRCPRAWAAMFEQRYTPGVAHVQFGVAGLNAHINRDLPMAVVQACQQRGMAPEEQTPQHQDYERVNSIIEAIEVTAMQRIATGIIGEVADELGRPGQVVAMWDIRQARNAAWVNAEVLWHQRSHPSLQERYLAVLDRMAGFASRGILIPTEGVSLVG